MTPWDGVCSNYRYKDPAGLLVDEGGTVYFIAPSGGVFVWCRAVDLRRHLHRLWNITHGKAVENTAYIAATGRNW